MIDDFIFWLCSDQRRFLIFSLLLAAFFGLLTYFLLINLGGHAYHA